MEFSFPFFHGKITRRTCEELLSKKKKNGSYLIRESESVEGALCLCVFFEDLIYTYRIFRECQGYFRIQTSEGVPERMFKTLKDLIYTFEKPNQGLITNLRYPVKKPKALRRSQRIKSGMDNIYDGSPSVLQSLGFHTQEQCNRSGRAPSALRALKLQFWGQSLSNLAEGKPQKYISHVFNITLSSVSQEADDSDGYVTVLP